MERKLRIAIQKAGRLHEDSIQLLKECGISIDNGKNHLKAEAKNYPLEVLYLRNGDIPQYLEDGVADIAIIGENLVVEAEKNIHILKPLGFSKCRLSLAMPKDLDYEGLHYFHGKRLATSYPNTLGNFLKSKRIEAEIHLIKGSVEIAPNIGLADGICDLVSSGNTLFTNGLKEVEVILKSQAAIVGGPVIAPEVRPILERMLFRVQAVLNAKRNRYILLNAPNDKLDEIASILPGMKSPTVLPLLEEGWSSVHSVISDTDFWEVIDRLKGAGAQGILVTPIEKMVL
jgi:ATP phosphoribosyltransferase